MAYKERVAYSVLQLKPWEFERLTPFELEKLERGFNEREKYMDSKAAFLTTLITNTQLKEGLNVADVMKALHPMTTIERIKANRAFEREWLEAEGGDIENG